MIVVVADQNRRLQYIQLLQKSGLLRVPPGPRPFLSDCLAICEIGSANLTAQPMMIVSVHLDPAKSHILGQSSDDDSDQIGPKNALFL